MRDQGSESELQRLQLSFYLNFLLPLWSFYPHFSHLYLFSSQNQINQSRFLVLSNYQYFSNFEIPRKEPIQTSNSSLSVCLSVFLDKQLLEIAQSNNPFPTAFSEPRF